jgi:hypothetical protein
MAPCRGLPKQNNLCGLAVVLHSAAALLSGSFLLTAGLVVAVLALLLLRVWRTLLPWLIGLVRLIAAGLVLSSHIVASLIAANM